MRFWAPLLALTSLAQAAQPVLPSLPSANATTRPAPLSVYGPDDRRDLFEITDPKIARLADSVSWLVNKDSVGTFLGTAWVSTKKHGERKWLCIGESFFEQPAAGFCSGALIAPDIVMTAGHCIEDNTECRNTSFVFGNAITEPGNTPKRLQARDVYGCNQVIAREYGARGGYDTAHRDWALIQLSRPVVDREPLKLSRGEVLRVGTPLILMGHPSGLPLKIAANARVTNNSDPASFRTDLDAFAGNSGSPVFNAETLEIEGILARGDDDYVEDPRFACKQEKKCTLETCTGESVSRVADVLPALESWKQ